MIEILQKSDKPEDLAARNRSGIEKQLEQIRQLGFDRSQRQSQTVTWRALAVPVFAGGRILASLSVRYIHKAVTQARENEELLPMLRTTAKRISKSFHAASANSSVEGLTDRAG